MPHSGLTDGRGQACRGDQLPSTVQPELRDNLTSQSGELKMDITDQQKLRDALATSTRPQSSLSCGTHFMPHSGLTDGRGRSMPGRQAPVHSPA